MEIRRIAIIRDIIHQIKLIEKLKLEYARPARSIIIPYLLIIPLTATWRFPPATARQACYSVPALHLQR